MPNVIGIIPARLKSSRFPGKVLVDIGGKSLIQRTYEQSIQSSFLDEVVIATEDKAVAEHAKSFGAKAFITKSSHMSGTDRIAEVVEAHYPDVDVVVNIQADEPMLDPKTLNQLVKKLLETPVAVCTTAVVEITEAAEIFDPSAVKCVFDRNGRALYFSRSPIPFAQKMLENHSYHRHLGIYCFRRDFLLTYASIDATPLQLVEDLEQLRILEHGYPLYVTVVEDKGIGVDTPEDLKRVEDRCLENTFL
ncbi:MAG: 3-deoxy-manno-octulosonate cytidylyltransferase [Chlamydiales bacterium]|nr:3-deoxy-manno-octulosonate cytidylyltransferase [Chlamydiales bacterium]MCH9620456.1 3-deoxy-manno-octulosonate cytidylyltransferase [Chlamydiales bacterium]MCH9623442.1 3-deoxy-manno-octulosonate cytidylyltransferase [Chlamydiales bacterium]